MPVINNTSGIPLNEDELREMEPHYNAWSKDSKNIGKPMQTFANEVWFVGCKKDKKKKKEKGGDRGYEKTYNKMPIGLAQSNANDDDIPVIFSKHSTNQKKVGAAKNSPPSSFSDFQVIGCGKGSNAGSYVSNEEEEDYSEDEYERANSHFPIGGKFNDNSDDEAFFKGLKINAKMFDSSYEEKEEPLPKHIGNKPPAHDFLEQAKKISAALPPPEKPQRALSVFKTPQQRQAAHIRAFQDISLGLKNVSVKDMSDPETHERVQRQVKWAAKQLSNKEVNLGPTILNNHINAEYIHNIKTQQKEGNGTHLVNFLASSAIFREMTPDHFKALQ